MVSGLLLILRANPAKPHAKCDEIGAHGGVRLRPDPPGSAVAAAMFVRIGGRQRGLGDATQPMHRRDRNATLGALERRLNGDERVITAQKMFRHPDRNVRVRDLAGEQYP